MSIDASKWETWINVASTVSLAIPEAGPIISGIFQSAAALIPEEQKSAFEGWVTDLEDQFSQDQEAAKQLISVYFNDEFGREWKNQDWQDICNTAATFLEPASDGHYLQDQVDMLIQDVGGSGASVQMSPQTFSNTCQQAWPFLSATCASLLRLGGAYVLAQWNNTKDPKHKNKPLYPSTSDTPAAGLLTDISAQYSDFAIWYYNICFTRRLRMIYCFPTGGVSDLWTAMAEGFGTVTGQSQSNLSEDDAKIAVGTLRQNALTDLAGMFATSSDQSSAWGAQCGANDWLNIKSKWWGNYSTYINSWTDDQKSSAPICAVPEPMQFQSWTQNRNNTKNVKDHIWNFDAMYLYSYTNVVAGNESRPSPLCAVQGNASYVGCQFTVPADLTGLANERRIYKSVIGPKLDQHGSQAEMTVDAQLVGSVDGSDQATFIDTYGYDVK